MTGRTSKPSSAKELSQRSWTSAAKITGWSIYTTRLISDVMHPDSKTLLPLICNKKLLMLITFRFLVLDQAEQVRQRASCCTPCGTTATSMGSTRGWVPLHPTHYSLTHNCSIYVLYMFSSVLLVNKVFKSQTKRNKTVKTFYLKVKIQLKIQCK